MTSAGDELIAAARRGDRAALEKLLLDEQQRIYAFGMRMCRDPEDARDVLQETMLAVARNIEDFRGDAAFSTWLFQIARSFCVKKRRRRKGAPAVHEPLEAAASAADAKPGPDDVVTAREREAFLHQALEQLPASAREVLVLRDVEGLSAKEVADVLDVSVDAVKSRLHRARASLEEALAPPLAAETGPMCVDVARMFSRKLEDELSPTTCREMEAHLESCPRCRGACAVLKENLAICQRHPDVPREVSERVRAALQRLLDAR